MYFQDVLVKNWNLSFSVFSLVYLFLPLTIHFFAAEANCATRLCPCFCPPLIISESVYYISGRLLLIIMSLEATAPLWFCRWLLGRPRRK
jgi:hypothetical protein